MTALAGGALLKLPSLGKPEDLPQVNGGFTRPKGPSHPAVGQGVNCPPLGPPGHWSSPGGMTDLSVLLCCVHTVQLFCIVVRCSCCVQLYSAAVLYFISRLCIFFLNAQCPV